MKHPAVTIDYTCPECGRETRIHVGAFYEAKLYGPPENCYPAEGGEFEPEVCECGERFDEVKVDELAWETREAAKEAHYDSLREERLLAKAEVFNSPFVKKQAE